MNDNESFNEEEVSDFQEPSDWLTNVKISIAIEYGFPRQRADRPFREVQLHILAYRLAKVDAHGNGKIGKAGAFKLIRELAFGAPKCIRILKAGDHPVYGDIGSVVQLLNAKLLSNIYMLEFYN